MNINTPSYWDAAWEKHREGYAQDANRHRVARFLKDAIPPGARVLDIGGGCGVLSGHIKETCAVKVIDFSVYALNVLSKNGIDTQYADISLYENDNYGEFDIVTVLDFLEHLDEPWRAVKCAANHADHAFFAVPDSCMGPESCSQHVRMYNMDSLQALLSEYWTSILFTKMGFDLIAETRK